MEPPKLLITGRPGVGKTTVVQRVAEELKKRGIRVGGMLTFEERSSGRRVGFKVVDIRTGVESTLASVYHKEGPRVGKYRVNTINLERVGVAAIEEALKTCDIVVCDEIGPMELYSDKFRAIVERMLESNKPVLATVHWRSAKWYEQKYGRRVEIIHVTLENRNVLAKEILGKLLAYLEEQVR